MAFLSKWSFGTGIILGWVNGDTASGMGERAALNSIAPLLSNTFSSKGMMKTTKARRRLEPLASQESCIHDRWKSN